MLKVTILVDCPDDNAIGVKESLAMDLEKYGDIKAITIEQQTPEQIKL